MRRVAIEFSYDGTDFFGYQIQNNVRTVQGELEKALEKVFKIHIDTYAAGRTDTGVHANGQVVSFDCPNDRLMENDIKNAINANLPGDIYIKKVWFTHPTFNPRYEAKRRIYHYYIDTSKSKNLFTRRYVWWFPYELDIEKMRIAAKYLIGEHDFISFSKKGEENTKTIRTINNLRIIEIKNGLILIRVEGISFLRGMVRSIVANLVRVGTGIWEPEKVKEVLESKDRSKSAGLAPAHGLFLYKVLF
ncbi:tRNA pseudouridine(38-40) synthase TruA [Fervidobacterium nodosum]|uniref:tRNA pseudouridine synthase A n=1 Tax=Fervidobacterium nodosum (strain ATCC 35602 / DSM 5306 / Rt17-B1) TaxID=381764 RepID=TRUA_FERNB|nr:tRNA pseudouridine(38-40) synthase TruA [Fervidobacterium nodosum]A7HKV8.1 RecName: Full=tRNA pseudouridine synthase A; AltName: Full=tRNA pseudouridine(38-40) synthase; AltName: Full=tRNA pseudouridylate synthase I; AltName: Full=tRNA-uridine isomerase I [Fervidobacterium nodosum Rt17-B1]ABS60541.1 tRNA pseudouridine synthase A [Fervidobacterium nodosum Rt17-B1]